jgi:hypothetical protein
LAFATWVKPEVKPDHHARRHQFVEGMQRRDAGARRFDVKEESSDPDSGLGRM